MFNLFNLFAKKEEVNTNTEAKMQAWINNINEFQSQKDNQIMACWNNSATRYDLEQLERAELKQTEEYNRLMDDLSKVLYPTQLKLL